jgi:hypothetical protein
VFLNIPQLRDVSCANLLKRFEVLFRFLKEMIVKLGHHYNESERILNEKGIEKGDVPYYKRKIENSDFVRLQNERKWQHLYNKFGIDVTLEPRVQLELEPFRPETHQKEEKSKLSKDKEDGTNDSDMNAEDLKSKLEEFVYQANVKNRGHYYTKVENPFSKTKKNKGRNIFWLFEFVRRREVCPQARKRET